MALTVELTIANLVLLGVLVFAAKKLIKLFKKLRLEQVLEKYNAGPKDKVILHTIWRCKDMPSISPFGLKLETYLRMAKIPYELETKDIVGPKGKLPWITYNGQHIADSQLIVEYLNKKLDKNLDINHSQETLAIARACRVMLEEHFFMGIVQFRGVENIGSMSDLVKLPTWLKLLLPLRKSHIKKRLETNGIGMHTPSEIYQMTEDDLRTVSQILGNKKFLGGDTPCTDDAAVFGIIAQAVTGLPGSSYERLVHGELSNLKEYCERMKELYWPDWEDCRDY